MTVIQMLREIVRHGNPMSREGRCEYCQAIIGGDVEEHDEDCVWVLAEAWLRKQEEAARE